MPLRSYQFALIEMLSKTILPAVYGRRAPTLILPTAPTITSASSGMGIPSRAPLRRHVLIGRV